MTSAEAIQTRLAQLKPRLEQEYPVDELGIFGSYAWGDQRSDSDLDVLVIFTHPVTLFDLVRLEFVGGCETVRGVSQRRDRVERPLTSTRRDTSRDLGTTPEKGRFRYSCPRWPQSLR